MSKRRTIEPLLTMHHNIVKDWLRKHDFPFCVYETHWWRKGQKHYNPITKKMDTIQTDMDCLISSYIDLPDGRCVRISNHKKQNGVPDSYIEVIYDWQTGKIMEATDVKDKSI